MFTQFPKHKKNSKICKTPEKIEKYTNPSKWSKTVLESPKISKIMKK